MFGEVIHRTIEDWFEKAIQFDTNYREAMAIFGQNQKNNEKITNRSWYRPTERKTQMRWMLMHWHLRRDRHWWSRENASNVGRQCTGQLIAQEKKTERGRRKKSPRKPTQWRTSSPPSGHWQRMKEKPLWRWCLKAMRIFERENWIDVSISLHNYWQCTSSWDWEK